MSSQIVARTPSSSLVILKPLMSLFRRRPRVVPPKPAPMPRLCLALRQGERPWSFTHCRAAATSEVRNGYARPEAAWIPVCADCAPDYLARGYHQRAISAR